MEINERWLQFSGKVIVPDIPSPESYLILSGEFEPRDVVTTPNDDGTVDYIQKVVPQRVVVQVGDKKLYGKSKKRASQRLRGAYWHEYQKLNGQEEYFEDSYENFISSLIAFLPEVQEFLGTKTNG